MRSHLGAMARHLRRLCARRTVDRFSAGCMNPMIPTLKCGATIASARRELRSNGIGGPRPPGDVRVLVEIRGEMLSRKRSDALLSRRIAKSIRAVQRRCPMESLPPDIAAVAQLGPSAGGGHSPRRSRFKRAPLNR
jgi:hypothetical protein